MLWLTFSIVSSPAGGVVGNPDGIFGAVGADLGGINGSAITSYLIGIGILVYSIKMAAQMGAAGGSMAANFGGKGLGLMKAGGKRVGRYAGERAASAGMRAGVATGASMERGFMGNLRRMASDDKKITMKQRIGAAAGALAAPLGHAASWATLSTQAKRGRQLGRVSYSARQKLDEERRKRAAPYMSRLTDKQRRDKEKEKTLGLLPTATRPQKQLLAKDYGKSAANIVKEHEELTTPAEKEQANMAMDEEITQLGQKREALKKKKKDLDKADMKRFSNLQDALSETGNTMASKNKHVDYHRVWDKAKPHDYNRLAKEGRFKKEAHRISAAKASEMLTHPQTEEETKQAYLDTLGDISHTGAGAGATKDEKTAKAEADRKYRNLRASTAANEEIESRTDTSATTGKSGHKELVQSHSRHTLEQAKRKVGSRFSAGDTVATPDGPAKFKDVVIRGTTPYVSVTDDAGKARDIPMSTFEEQNASKK